MPTPHEADAARRGASSGTDVDVVCPPIGSGGRWIAYAHGLFYGSVSVATAVALAEAGRVQIATQIGISALVVAWYSYWIARRGRAVASSTAFGDSQVGPHPSVEPKATGEARMQISTSDEIRAAVRQCGRHS
jgi:hypothetical protein